MEIEGTESSRVESVGDEYPIEMEKRIGVAD